MKPRFIMLLLILSVFSIKCSLIEIEHDDDLIVQLEGKWKLISITFDGKQEITSCDKTTVSEFRLDEDENPKDTNFNRTGGYIGTVYFWTEALDSCNPETFSGKWKWDDDEVKLILTISGNINNISYSNDFDISYYYSNGTDNGELADKIDFTFKNDDEDFERIYLYERIN